jgi:hypothetical protein
MLDCSARRRIAAAIQLQAAVHQLQPAVLHQRLAALQHLAALQLQHLAVHQLQPAVTQLQLAVNQFVAKLKSLAYVKDFKPEELLSLAAKFRLAATKL